MFSAVVSACTVIRPRFRTKNDGQICKSGGFRCGGAISAANDEFSAIRDFEISQLQARAP